MYRLCNCTFFYLQPEVAPKEPDISISNPISNIISGEPDNLLPESRLSTPVIEINSSSPIITPEPDISLSVMLQLQQQVAHQSQLIGQLQQKVEALETFNQQLIQMWREDNQYAHQRTAQYAVLTELPNF